MVAAKPFALGLVILAHGFTASVQALGNTHMPRSDHRTPSRAGRMRRYNYAAGGEQAQAGPAHEASDVAIDASAPAAEAAWPTEAAPNAASEETAASSPPAKDHPAKTWAANPYAAASTWPAAKPYASRTSSLAEQAPAPTATWPTYEGGSAPPPETSWAAPTATHPAYGSGYEPNPALDGCVASCSASFGIAQPTASAAPSPPAASGGATPPPPAEGTKTHTVIVAPSQGVLKFVPFTINANPGDTIRYQWGAGPHTVTKSSLLGICNATTVEPFNSGRLNKSAEFDHVVGSADPTFVFCGVQPHCVKGMFSIVNPPSAPANLTAGSQAAASFDPWLASMAANSTAVQTMVDQAKGVVGNNTAAWAWGGKMVMDGGMEEWAKMATIENTLWTRMSLATNPAALTDGFSLKTFNAPPPFADLGNSTNNRTGAGHSSSGASGGVSTPTPGAAASGGSAVSGGSAASGGSAGVPSASAGSFTSGADVLFAVNVASLAIALTTACFFSV